mgnify:CR=1 FL=1
MDTYKFTEYFETEVIRKCLYLKNEWSIRVIENPIKVEPQEHNRFRFLGFNIRTWGKDITSHYP